MINEEKSQSILKEADPVKETKKELKRVDSLEHELNVKGLLSPTQIEQDMEVMENRQNSRELTRRHSKIIKFVGGKNKNNMTSWLALNSMVFNGDNPRMSYKETPEEENEE